MAKKNSPSLSKKYPAPKKGPKVLIFDIETSPMEVWSWGLWDVNVPLNMIKRDWTVLSVSAKWLGSPANQVMYQDQSQVKDVFDDTALLGWIWQLLDEADVVLTQNGKKFDVKKLNARFVLRGMKPPSPYKHIDTLVIAKKHFGLTSNKLEYMTENLCVKHKKQKHSDFGGFVLWKECMAGNPKAWKAMRKYNCWDVLSLEELYYVFESWDQTVNFNLYFNEEEIKCNCGSFDLQRRGYSFTNSGKFQRYQCKDCGAWHAGKLNLLTKDKKASLLRKA